MKHSTRSLNNYFKVKQFYMNESTFTRTQNTKYLPYHPKNSTPKSCSPQVSTGPAQQHTHPQSHPSCWSIWKNYVLFSGRLPPSPSESNTGSVHPSPTSLYFWLFQIDYLTLAKMKCIKTRICLFVGVYCGPKTNTGTEKNLSKTTHSLLQHLKKTNKQKKSQPRTRHQ